MLSLLHILVYLCKETIEYKQQLYVKDNGIVAHKTDTIGSIETTIISFSNGDYNNNSIDGMYSNFTVNNISLGINGITTSEPLTCLIFLHVEDIDGSRTGKKTIELKWCEDFNIEFLKVKWNCTRHETQLAVVVCASGIRNAIFNEIRCNSTINIDKCFPDCENTIHLYNNSNCQMNYKVDNTNNPNKL